jgi:hypothetical protein
MDPTICETCGTDEPPSPPPQRVRAAVFFDGTGNNRVNARARSTDHVGFERNLPASTASYESAPSNIAKGEEEMGQYRDVENVGQHYYIEGIGTQTDGRDIPEGMSLGTGITGVMAKMRAGLDQLVSDISQLDPARPIEKVEIDTFGFSRGAAAARHFVHVALNDRALNVRKQLEDRGFTVNDVTVTFVGLYDTVASYGVQHSNDTRDLNLDAIRNAEYTFQLAAGDEHRANFRLTDIRSAPAGKQIFLPGVHSDIGGGYNDHGRESDHQVVDLDWRGLVRRSADLASLERERNWLIQRGWYTERELSQPNYAWEILGNRRNIRNTYANLALNMMADEAVAHGVPFSPELSAFHPIPRDAIVTRVKALIDASVAAGNVAKGDAYKDYWLQMSEPSLNAVRHKYFHMSSRYGESAGAHAPNYTAHPSDGGVRRRVVQRG